MKVFLNIKFLLVSGILSIALITRFANAEENRKTITVFGDSLVAGYGLSPGESFPEQLQKHLKKKGVSVKVLGSGVSGDTSTGGLARLDWSIGDDVDAVILELGANDALRGIPPELTAENLEKMVLRLQERGKKVLLAGMLAPPNMGPDYGETFNAIYPDLAKKHDLVFYPFFLDGVAGNLDLNLPDGIHPTAEGISVMVEKIEPYVMRLLEKTK